MPPTSHPRPLILKAAIVVAWLCFAMGLLAALSNPWALLFAVPFAAGAIGLQRGRGAAGSGLALWICALLAGLATNFGRGNPDLPWGLVIFSFALYLATAALFVLGARRASGSMLRPGWGWVAASLGTLVFFSFFQMFVVPTGAMESTILIGDYLVIRKGAGDAPRRGEIVVFRYPVDPRQIFVKRVVAVPGDRLRVEHKRLVLNGQPVAEPFAVHRTSYEDSYRDNFPSTPNMKLFPSTDAMLQQNVEGGEVVVPSGKYFVMGDNRDHSLDSRYWGFIDAAGIVGRPLFVCFSTDLPTEKLASSDEIVFATLHARWGRMFRRL